MNKTSSSNIFSKLLGGITVSLSEDENFLIKEVANGNQKAFKKIFDKYKKPIMNYIYSMTKNRSIAENITQDVFMKVFIHAAKFDDAYKFRTWLWTIAKRTTFDYLKKKKEVLFNDFTSVIDHTDFAQNIADDDKHIDDKLIQRAESEIFNHCFEELKVSQKRVMSLRIHSELSYKDIAELENTTESAVKSLIVRAKSSLKKCVTKCLGDKS